LIECSTLKNKKQQLLGKISAVTNENISVLQSSRSEYEGALAAVNDEVAEALTLTSEEDHIEFLRKARPLIDRILQNQSKLEGRPPNINPPSGQKWKIDLGPLIEVVKKIDFSSDIRFKQKSSKQSPHPGAKNSHSQQAVSVSPVNINSSGDSTIMKENIQILPNDNSDTVSMTSSSSKKKMSTFDKLQNMMLSTTINGKKNNNKGNAMVTSSASISSDKFVDCDDDHY